MTVQGRSAISPHRASEYLNIRDTDLNNSDKIFTVPTDRVWEPIYLRYEITATATVGTRTPTIQYRDNNSDDILFDVVGPTVTASGSSTQEADTADTATDLHLPIGMILAAGFDIRVADTAAVDAAADDLVVHLLVREYVTR